MIKGLFFSNSTKISKMYLPGNKQREVDGRSFGWSFGFCPVVENKSWFTLRCRNMSLNKLFSFYFTYSMD
jgi:hypothetical protein